MMLVMRGTKGWKSGSALLRLSDGANNGAANGRTAIQPRPLGHMHSMANRIDLVVAYQNADERA